MSEKVKSNRADQPINLSNHFTNAEFFQIYKNTYLTPFNINGTLMRLVNSYRVYSVLEGKPISYFIEDLRDSMQEDPQNDEEFILFGAAIHALSNDIKRLDCLYLQDATRTSVINIDERIKKHYSSFVRKYGVLSTKNMKESCLSNELYAFSILSNRYNDIPYKLMQKVLPYLYKDSHQAMLIGTIIYVLKHGIEIKIND